jgi:hypothetical protein
MRLQPCCTPPLTCACLGLPPDDTSGEYLEMAFSKKKVEDRKRWLSSFVPGTYLDQSVDKISYADFVNKVRSSCAHTAVLDSSCWQLA